jgi:hypothetical protein
MSEVRELIDAELDSEVRELIYTELDAVCGGWPGSFLGAGGSSTAEDKKAGDKIKAFQQLLQEV